MSLRNNLVFWAWRSVIMQNGKVIKILKVIMQIGKVIMQIGKVTMHGAW